MPFPQIHNYTQKLCSHGETETERERERKRERTTTEMR